MKPCSKHRKLITWLALDALDAREAAILRHHFAQCEGCHRYWEEISIVTERVASAQPDSNLETSESFHQKVTKRVEGVEYSSVLMNPAAWLRGLRLNWRLALPAIAVMVIAVIALVAPRHQQTASRSAPPTVEFLSAPDPAIELAPTLANYQMVAHLSLEKLDELLTRQGKKRLPPVPHLTIWSLQPTEGSF